MNTSTSRLGRWRKAPVQARVDDTLRAIFEATAQLLENESLARLSTNRIAARAGFAVGTLYQYFPNKQELLVAMAEDELERGLHTLDAVAQAQAGAPREAAVRAVVAVWLRAFGGRHKVMGDVIRTVLLHRDVQDVHRRFAPAALRAADRLITVTGTQDHPSLTPELRFVLGHALLSSVRAALLDEPAMIARPAFEDALVRLALGLLPVA